MSMPLWSSLMLASSTPTRSCSPKSSSPCQVRETLEKPGLDIVLYFSLSSVLNSQLSLICSCHAAIQKQLSMMKNGEGGLSVFLGLTGTKEELGLKADNYWIFTENNFDELYVFRLQLPV